MRGERRGVEGGGETDKEMEEHGNEENDLKRDWEGRLRER
jgi:hypothetical protein